MRLYDEIFKSADGAAFARCLIVPNGGGYFEGVKAVGDFSPRRIVLCFPREEVVAEGEDLAIKKYCDGDLEISGKIYALYLSGYLKNTEIGMEGASAKDENVNETVKKRRGGK